MKSKGVISMIEETTPDFTEKTFKDAVPEYSFSGNGTQIVVRVKPIVGADGYEVYQSEKKHAGYSLVVESSSPVVDFYVPDGKSYYYKVRAFHGTDAERITTDYSEPQYVDLVTASKIRDERIENFFNSLKEIGEVLSFEDLDVLYFHKSRAIMTAKSLSLLITFSRFLPLISSPRSLIS